MRILRIDFTFICEYELLLMVLRNIPDICIIIIYVRDSPHTNIHSSRSIDLPTYVYTYVANKKKKNRIWWVYRFYVKINITSQTRRSPRNLRWKSFACLSIKYNNAFGLAYYNEWITIDYIMLTFFFLFKCCLMYLTFYWWFLNHTSHIRVFGLFFFKHQNAIQMSCFYTYVRGTNK